MAEINPGDVYRATNAPGFKNAAGVLTDPTTVTFKWRRFDEVTTWTWTAAVPGTNILRDSTGLFHADIPIVDVGMHHIRWEGTGAVTAAEEGSFFVTSRFPAAEP